MLTSNRERRKKQEKKRNISDKNFKEKLTEVLELPKEIVLDVPKITMIGNSNFVVENHKGIIEYGDNRIKINTGKGLMKIQGNGLSIREITLENIIVTGKIGNNMEA